MSTKAILEVCSDKIISYKPGTQANLDFQLLQTPPVTYSPRRREGRKELSADKALQETPGREPKSARNHAVSLGAHTAARDGRAKALTSMRTAATLAQMQA